MFVGNKRKDGHLDRLLRLEKIKELLLSYWFTFHVIRHFIIILPLGNPFKLSYYGIIKVSLQVYLQQQQNIFDTN